MAVKYMLASSSENNVRSVVTFEFYLSTTTINGKCRGKKDALKFNASFFCVIALHITSRVNNGVTSMDRMSENIIMALRKQMVHLLYLDSIFLFFPVPSW